MAAAILLFVPRAPETMNAKKTDKQDRSYNNKLHPDDQKEVDEFLSRGVNSVPRKPFRPLRLLILLIGTVLVLSFLSQSLVHWAGIY